MLIKKIVIAVVLVWVSYTLTEGIIISSLQERDEEIYCTMEEGIKGQEKEIVIKEIKPYDDTEKAYPIVPTNRLICMTIAVTNLSDRDQTVYTDYPVMWLKGEQYENIEIVGSLDETYDTYDVRQKGNSILIPIGRTREITYILEVDKKIKSIQGRYMENEPISKSYMIEIPVMF